MASPPAAGGVVVEAAAAAASAAAAVAVAAANPGAATNASEAALAAAAAAAALYACSSRSRIFCLNAPIATSTSSSSSFLLRTNASWKDFIPGSVPMSYKQGAGATEVETIKRGFTVDLD